jgi:hypothetical protein
MSCLHFNCQMSTGGVCYRCGINVPNQETASSSPQAQAQTYGTIAQRAEQGLNAGWWRAQAQQGLTEREALGCLSAAFINEGETGPEAMRRVREIAQAALRASTAAAPSPVPAGFVLVPVEPTEEMVAALSQGAEFSTDGWALYSAMLAAAPGAPHGQQEQQR